MQILCVVYGGPAVAVAESPEGVYKDAEPVQFDRPLLGFLVADFTHVRPHVWYSRIYKKMSEFFSEFDAKNKKQEVDWNKAKTVHVDAGASLTDDYQPKSAFFTVLNDNGRLIHDSENIGAVWAVEAEYRAIEWALKKN